jgi:hypothetical protein
MLQLNAHVSADDLQRDIAFVKADTKQHYQSPWPRRVGLFIFFFILGLLATRYARNLAVDAGHQWLIILTGVMFVTAMVWSLLWFKNGGLAAWLAQCSGDYHWEINAQGISVRVKDASNLFAWSNIIALMESDEAWYFYLRRNIAISIPKQASEANNEKVQAHLVSNVAAEYWRKHPDNHGLTLPNNLTQGLQQKSFWSDLSTNLLGGMQLAFFAKVTGLSFKVCTSQWIALIVLEVLIIAFFDYCTAGVNPQFNIYGFTHYSANYLLLLLAGIYILHVAMASQWLGRLVIMLLSATIVMELVYLPVRTALILKDGYVSTWLNWLVWAIYVVWLLLVAGRTIRKLINYPLPTILLLTTSYSFFVLVLSGFLVEQSFFTEDYDAKYDAIKTPKIDVESTYYQQAAMVNKAVDALKPERAGVADLYFVGLAGASYQDVFLNEVQFTQKLFDKSFDTVGRSILLANHQSTLNSLPLGNLHNLSDTLDGMAKRMNKDEDILFLFLSSHGSQPNENRLDYEISTDFYPFQQNNIEAKKLKIALDASGIKNRVIVVSACHSGGFVDALKDENSLIMAAARKDRSSFGCGNEEKFTYFGDAYFVQSLNKMTKIGAHSFSQAFDNAKKIISKKEQALQKDSPASEPQMYQGSAIKAKLAELEARLRAAKP